MSGEGGATDLAKEKCLEAVNELHRLRDVFDELIIQGGDMMGAGRWSGKQANNFHQSWDGAFRTQCDENFIILRDTIRTASTIAANILESDQKDAGELRNETEVLPLSATEEPPLDPTYANDNTLTDATALKTKIETDVYAELDAMITAGETAANEFLGGDKVKWETHWEEEVAGTINDKIKPQLDQIALDVDTAITNIETAAGGFA